MAKLPTQYLKLTDFSMAYTEYGNGKTVILIHGNSESKSIFKRYQTEILKDFHTIALDSRGHGQSLCEQERYTIEQIADDVIEFCNEKGVDHAMVVGYSDGGNVALYLAKKDANRFTKLVALSPNYLVNATKPNDMKMIMDLIGFQRFLGKLGLNTRHTIAIFDLMLHDIGLSDDDLRIIASDMFILYAENDMFYEEHFLKIGELIPHCRLEKILRANHMNMLYHPQTIKAIKDNLSSLNFESDINQFSVR